MSTLYCNAALVFFYSSLFLPTVVDGVTEEHSDVFIHNLQILRTCQEVLDFGIISTDQQGIFESSHQLQ